MRTRILCLLLLTITIAGRTMAVPAHPGTAQVRQPDGSIVTLRLHGDEWHHFTTTVDGYTVVKDTQGRYVYADLRQGVLHPTGMTAHDPQQRSTTELGWLSAVPKRLSPAMDSITVSLRQQLRQQTEAQATRRASGYDLEKFKGLIILVEYNDKKFSREDYKSIVTDMANKENYSGFDNEVCTGSVYDYFRDNSQGRFLPKFDIAGPYTVDYSQYFVNGTSRANTLIRAALKAADNDVDYSQYDGDGDGTADLVFLIFAGLGANYTANDQRLLWPHRSMVWSRFDDVAVRDYVCTVELCGRQTEPDKIKLDGIGTICHEFSHVLGLPDFYDTDYEANGGESNHPDDWSVMATGCYLNDARTPVGYSLYERYSVGFMDAPPVISEAGDYTLEPLPVSQQGYRIDSSIANEFFLLENRQPTAFPWDAYLPGGGMLVHRVDKTSTSPWSSNTVNERPAHNYYELLRAGGPHYRKASDGSTVIKSTDSDPFPGSAGVSRIDNTTQPAALCSWNGTPTPWILTDITQSADGTVSFRVEPDGIPQGIAQPRRDSQPAAAGSTLYNLHGQRIAAHQKGIQISKGKKLIIR